MFPFLFLPHTHLFGYIFEKTRKTNHHILYINRVSILLTCSNHFHDCFLSSSACSEAGQWSVMYIVYACQGYIFCFYPRFFNWMLEIFQQFCFIFYCYLLGMPDQRGISLTYLLTNHYHFVKSYLNISWTFLQIVPWMYSCLIFPICHALSL